MNLSFRVVFNKARGALMVVNEMTSSVQAKGTKTVIATAVATLMAGGAVAATAPTTDSSLPDTITNSTLPGFIFDGEETTKLTSGRGQTVNIQTDGSMSTFLHALANAEGLSGLLGALAPSDPDKNGNRDHVIMTGVTGGYNFTDKTTASLIPVAVKLLFKNEPPENKDKVEKLGQQLKGQFIIPEDAVLLKTGDTHILIGSDKHSPIVLGVVGGDAYASALKNQMTIDRDGTSNITIANGNTAGVIAGHAGISSPTISLKGFEDSTNQAKLSTSLEQTNLALIGESNVAGFFGGSLALGMNKADVSGTIKNSTNIRIDMNEDASPANLNGMVIGGFGGGLALSTGGANATVNNGETTNIVINDGEVLGILGGGAAVTGSISLDEKKSLLNLFAKALIGDGSGTSSSTSGDITFLLGEKSTSAAVAGGGLSLAHASQTSKNQAENHGHTTSKVGTVNMTFEGPVASLTPDQKAQLNKTISTHLPKIIALAKSAIDGTLGSQKVDELINGFEDFAGGVAIDGVHFGNLGGGITAALGDFEANSAQKASAIAESNVGTVVMNFNGGYNVATAAGGLAIAADLKGTAKTENLTIKSSSDVDTVALNITGGENIMMTAGGLAFATGDHGQDSNVSATANIKEAGILMTGGSVDGLYGAGIAIDDTAASKQNAQTHVETLGITVKGGTINVANVSPMLTELPPGNTSTNPSSFSYIHQTAALLGENYGNVAILGGGIATGGGALASVDKIVGINLEGGEVKGNIFAGGAATLGALAHVEEAQVQINGAKVTGDIYGGGLSGSPDNDKFADDYTGATSTVGKTTVALLKGELNGNVYLNGKVFNKVADKGDSAQTQAEADGDATKKPTPSVTVNKGHIVINKDFVFKGDTMSGEGVKDATFTADGGYTFAKDKPVTLTAFSKLASTDTVTNAKYDFGDKTATTVNGIFDFNEMTGTAAKTLTLEKGAVAVRNAAANTFVVKEGVLGLGSDATTDAAQKAMRFYEGDAALYLSGTADISKAPILIGKTDAKDGVSIGSNAMVIVDASVTGTEEEGKTVVTTVTGQITGEEGSSIHFVNVADQGLVHVDTTIDKKNWTVDNVLFEVKETTDDTYSFELVTDAGKLGELGLGGLNAGALVDISKQDDAASEALQALLDPTNKSIHSADHRHAQIQGSLNLAAAGGVQTAGIEGALMGIDQATKRASLTNVFKDGWTGFAELTGTQLRMGGDATSLETKTTLGGLALGGEYTKGDMTFGVLGNFGTGDVKGRGDNEGVKNDVDYYGVTGYAAKRFGDFNLVGQVGYVMTDNDITQSRSDKVKVDADVFTVGVRGEMAMAFANDWSAVPYAGVNYLRVGTEGYTTKQGFKVGDVDQNLVNMPVGVAVVGNFATSSGWTVRPMADLAYVHTFGDADVNVTTHVGATALDTTLDVWSEKIGRVKFGVETMKDNMAFGFSLGGAVGSTDYRELYGQVRAKFLF